MLMFLKNPIKRCQIRQKSAIIFKRRKIMVFEILTFDFYLEEKRKLYMNATTNHNEKLKELVYSPLNIVRYKFSTL